MNSEPEGADLEAAARLESGGLTSPGRGVGNVARARSSEELLINADEADVDEVDHLIQVLILTDCLNCESCATIHFVLHIHTN